MNNNCGNKKCGNMCQDVEVREGTTECYNKDYEVCGKKQAIINKHYHKNNITRYNDIMVTDCHYFKNYVKDCNRVHHKTEKIDLGTEHVGCSTVDCGCCCEDCNCGCCKPDCCNPQCNCECCKPECDCGCQCQQGSNCYIDLSKCCYGCWCDCNETENNCGCNNGYWC